MFIKNFLNKFSQFSVFFKRNKYLCLLSTLILSCYLVITTTEEANIPSPSVTPSRGITGKIIYPLSQTVPMYDIFPAQNILSVTEPKIETEATKFATTLSTNDSSPPLKLLAIVGKSGKYTALLYLPKEKREFIVQVGDKVLQYRCLSISSNQVILQNKHGKNLTCQFVTTY